MPAPPSDRQILGVRVSRTGIRMLDKIAAAEGVDRSEVVRRFLADSTARWVAEHGDPRQDALRQAKA